jgi:Spy/CpxP family protein refolding chaperone
MQSPVSKRTAAIVAGALVIAAIAGVAFAQVERGDRSGRPLLRAYMQGLQQCGLSQEQQDKVKAIFESSKMTMRSVADQLKADRANLNVALDATQPDPTAVGTATLKLRADRHTIKDQLKTTNDAVLAVLNPDQKARFEGYLQGLRILRGRRADRAAAPRS